MEKQAEFGAAEGQLSTLTLVGRGKQMLPYQNAMELHSRRSPGRQDG
jgi:hypothetical protein